MSANCSFSIERENLGANALASNSTNPTSAVAAVTANPIPGPLNHPIRASDASTVPTASEAVKTGHRRRTSLISSVRQGIKRAFSISRSRASYNEVEEDETENVTRHDKTKKGCWWICCEPRNMFDVEGDKCNKRNYEPETICYNCGHILCSYCEIDPDYNQEYKRRAEEEATQQAINSRVGFENIGPGGRLVEPEVGFSGLTFEHRGDGRVSRMAMFEDDDSCFTKDLRVT